MGEGVVYRVVVVFRAEVVVVFMVVFRVEVVLMVVFRVEVVVTCNLMVNAIYQLYE